MKIMCYGDSNTYGMNPLDGSRYNDNIRWPKVLQDMLGKDYEIIEEGQNGRTTIYDDEKPNRNGMKDLIPCLNKHKSVDMIILMLGTNDLKKRFHASSQDIANNVGQLVDVIQKETDVQIILVSPMEVTKGIEKGNQILFGSEKLADSIRVNISGVKNKLFGSLISTFRVKTMENEYIICSPFSFHILL